MHCSDEKRKIRFKGWTRWWGYGGRKGTKSCWRRITDNAVEMICDELVWSLLVNPLQKSLQREADISVTGKGGGALWVTLLLPLWAKSRAQTRQTQLNIPVTRLGPFLLWHDTKPKKWLFSFSNTRHESKWWKTMILHMDFFLKSSYALR